MAVLWWGARLVINGHLSAGQLSSFVVYAIFVSGNVGQLAGVFSSLMQVYELPASTPPACAGARIASLATRLTHVFVQRPQTPCVRYSCRKEIPDAICPNEMM